MLVLYIIPSHKPMMSLNLRHIYSIEGAISDDTPRSICEICLHDYYFMIANVKQIIIFAT
jgi:hypothetical protein